MRGAAKVCLLAVLLFGVASTAHAAGPRWVAGSPWWNYGQPMSWEPGDLTYWLDSGSLSAYVDHDAAVALVDAAANTWNIPSSKVHLSRGGTLAEDVDGSNVYLGSDGPIWPADVDQANHLQVQIAVILDADGTLTDMLRGQDASSPANCRTAAVTETVDLFVQPGRIAHAVLLLNGRCTGPAAEQQLQLHYQLMRAFGRVLGLGWSQTNDNVFTGSPAPTYQQQMHWPIMHPIDIVCGVYTYQCLPQPFTLRDDDISSVNLLYANETALTTATGLSGHLLFPDGRQAAGVNVAIRRSYPFGTYGTDPYEDVSAVSGYAFKGNNGNPVSGPVTGDAAWQGITDESYAGFWIAKSVPIVNDFFFMNFTIEPQRINPLYVRGFQVGPYGIGSVDPPAGIPPATEFYFVAQGGLAETGPLQNTAATHPCSASSDADESAPARLNETGEWKSRFCSYGQSSWTVFPVRAGRSLTVEVSALDESGAVSGNKAMPVIGLWHAADPSGANPSIAAAPSAFNARLHGMTQMRASIETTELVRLGLSDERGDGRPDFGYSARVFYADTVEPATLPAGGGAVQIFGTGFQPGNTVAVNGVLATVTRVTSTEIDAVVHPAVLPESGADVTVTDLRTGASATIANALFGGPARAYRLQVLKAPAGTSPLGVPSALKLRLLDSSGVAVAHSAVALSVRAGAALFASCLDTMCVLITDAAGVVQETVSATSAGPVTLEAVGEAGASLLVSFVATAPVRAIQPLRPIQYVAARSGAPLLAQVTLLENGGPVLGVAVHWNSPGRAVQTLASEAISDASGAAGVPLLATLTGGESLHLNACAWTETPLAVCTTVPLLGVAMPDLRISNVSGDLPPPGTATSGTAAVSFRVTDRDGHGVAGAEVEVHQALWAQEPPCPSTGRCPTPPFYGSSVDSVVSDSDGRCTVAPLQSHAAAAVLQITATAGTDGTASLTLALSP